MSVDVAPALTLSPDEAVALTEVAEAFAAALPPERAGRYLRLAADAATGRVGLDLLPDVERVCATSLETGQARQHGRAETEGLLSEVYRRTPAGRSLAADASDINDVLSQLSGRTLLSVRVVARKPGRYLLHLRVDGVELTLSLDPQTLSVSSLQVG